MAVIAAKRINKVGIFRLDMMLTFKTLLIFLRVLKLMSFAISVK